MGYAAIGNASSLLDCLSDALCLDLQQKVVAAVCHGPAALTEAKLNG